MPDGRYRIQDQKQREEMKNWSKGVKEICGQEMLAIMFPVWFGKHMEVNDNSLEMSYCPCPSICKETCLAVHLRLAIMHSPGNLSVKQRVKAEDPVRPKRPNVCFPIHASNAKCAGCFRHKPLVNRLNCVIQLSNREKGLGYRRHEFSHQLFHDITCKVRCHCCTPTCRGPCVCNKILFYSCDDMDNEEFKSIAAFDVNHNRYCDCSLNYF